MQIRCNFPDISYLSETQKNNFQFLSKLGNHWILKAHAYSQVNLVIIDYLSN